MRNRFYGLGLLIAVAGCTGNGVDSTPPAQASGECKGDGLASFVGQKVSAELGAKMLAASGARSLRWAPPRSAMTMDFRPDRLTVAYDDNMVIESARCG